LNFIRQKNIFLNLNIAEMDHINENQNEENIQAKTSENDFDSRKDFAPKKSNRIWIVIVSGIILVSAVLIVIKSNVFNKKAVVQENVDLNFLDSLETKPAINSDSIIQSNIDSMTIDVDTLDAVNNHVDSSMNNNTNTTSATTSNSSNAHLENSNLNINELSSSGRSKNVAVTNLASSNVDNKVKGGANVKNNIANNGTVNTTSSPKSNNVTIAKSKPEPAKIENTKSETKVNSSNNNGTNATTEMALPTTSTPTPITFDGYMKKIGNGNIDFDTRFVYSELCLINHFSKDAMITELNKEGAVLATYTASDLLDIMRTNDRPIKIINKQTKNGKVTAMNINFVY
jgi:hypothetical protein